MSDNHTLQIEEILDLLHTVTHFYWLTVSLILKKGNF